MLRLSKLPLKIINADIRAFRSECELSGLELTRIYETDPGECFYIYTTWKATVITVKYSRQIAGIGKWHREVFDEYRNEVSKRFAGGVPR
jgi:hypothetical protein